MHRFRFQDLEIWEDAIVLSDQLLDLADEIESKKLFRFAEQLRGACLSISNNIAEGSGSDHAREFKQFINYARRSGFETANILIILARRSLIGDALLEELLDRIDHLCRKMTLFKRRL